MQRSAGVKLDWPLMVNNIPQEDLDVLRDFLSNTPRLTQSEKVREFERQWSQWVGVKHSIYVNSGASANLVTMSVIKHLFGSGEVIVPTLTWVSDIASVIQNGLTPVFVDINPKNLCMDEDEVISKISDRTVAVFMTYVQGFNGLSDKLLKVLEDKNIPLIEDVCESHGATFKGQRLGSFGLISNFSFYFAHHMSTIEGGMICTDDENVYQMARMMRSHGMVREATDEKIKQQFIDSNPDLSPDFIFAYPAYNVRGNEIGGILGLSQLKRLDENNEKRRQNLKCFLDNLDSEKFRTDFDLEGSCNYAFNLILKKQDPVFRERLEQAMTDANVEFRRGSSGGGNQMRQPYLKDIVAKDQWLKYPHVEHVHFYGYYIGNYPVLEEHRIKALCQMLNNV